MSGNSGGVRARAFVVLACGLALGSACRASAQTASEVDPTPAIGSATGPIERDDQPMTIIRGSHPRRAGVWPQYLGLDTALRQNITITDTVLPTSTWENYRGEPNTTHDVLGKDGVPLDRYAHMHNHYQNVLVETWNFVPGANAVSVWGDSASLVNGGKSWGAFFSARSNARFEADPLVSPHLPVPLPINDPAEFDCQLIGVEIDVLNRGKPGVWPNMSKTGLQIVGFGNPNSMAIEVRCQGSGSKNPADWLGRFEAGLYFLDSIQDYGRLIVADFAGAKMGLDFRKPIFTEGAIRFSSRAPGQGIIINNHASGEIYGGRRWVGMADEREFLSLRAGTGGIRLTNHDNTREILAADNDRGLYLYGDIYVNDQRVDFARLMTPPPQIAPKREQPWRHGAWQAAVAIVAVGGLTLAAAGHIALRRRLARTLDRLAQLERAFAAVPSVPARG